MTAIEGVKELLDNATSIVITTHRKPDGDALGSSLAMLHYLKQKGKDVTVITPTDYPDFLDWLPGNNEVIDYNNSDQAASDELIKKADVIFCLDFNHLKRVEDMEEKIRACSAKTILIDHHTNPEKFENYDLADSSASSTAELVYDFICDLGDKELINKDIGECIYTGIMTDTGSFRFPGTTAKTHRIVAQLLELGVDNTKVHEQVFDNFPETRVKFLGYCLKEKLKIFKEYSTAIIDINPKELTEYNIRSGDTEGLVNYGLAIKGINMAALVVDRDEKVKISFRSKNGFKVNEFSQKYFNGGGHTKAAGGISDVSLEETVSKIISLLPEYKDQLNQTD
ncbi:MAG: DHH family phosphoesterase [Bacteroidetes bacterium]|nr:bifunctional oligoribonuclease/PAP phosphatase NrnA [Bacteroidia bacterium]PCH68207.1 MAG: DHH family phosphoesterase [Bacteroidota bacterium]